jgi:hypothetical protein
VKLVFSVLEWVGDCEDKFSRKYRAVVLDELKKGRLGSVRLTRNQATRPPSRQGGLFSYYDTGSWHQGD